MFDLEQSIAEWRQQMFTAGIKSPAPLEELESHLREDIEQQMESGIKAQPAFETALGQMGPAGALKVEFVNVGVPIHERLKQVIFSFAGISNQQLATNMNTSNLSTEPRWATYAKAGTFLFPALFMWLLTVVFVLPKVNELCQKAGMTIFNFDRSAPAAVRAWGVIGQVMILLTNHWLFIGGVIVLTFILLERYLSQWPRYRRTALGVGAFLLNAAVLLSLTIMIVSIIVATSALPYHVR